MNSADRRYKRGYIWLVWLILLQDSVEFIICFCIFIDTFYSSGEHTVWGIGLNIYVYSLILWIPPIGARNVTLWLAWPILFQDSVEFIICCCIFINTFFSSGGHTVWGIGSHLYIYTLILWIPPIGEVNVAIWLAKLIRV
jgi:hypothetical protein